MNDPLIKEALSIYIIQYKILYYSFYDIIIFSIQTVTQVFNKFIYKSFKMSKRILLNEVNPDCSTRGASFSQKFQTFKGLKSFKL